MAHSNNAESKCPFIFGKNGEVKNAEIQDFYSKQKDTFKRRFVFGICVFCIVVENSTYFNGDLVLFALFAFVCFKLDITQFFIFAVQRNQFCIGSLFDDAAVFDNANYICIQNG